MLETKSTSVKKDKKKKSKRKDALKTYDSPQESYRHRIIKQLFYKAFNPDTNRAVQVCSLEKYFDSRRADVYVKFRTGKEMVIEVQSSKISAKEIETRTKYYNKKGIYVLWVLDGNGAIIGSKKRPENRKDSAVSYAEKKLHSMYQGRVYYVNVIERKKKSTITVPYALYFTPSDKYHANGYNTKYETFYVRNLNFAFIQNYSEPLLIKNKTNGYLIARFYDKNLKQTLITELTNYLHQSHSNKNFKKNKICKKIVLEILKAYGKEHGKTFILDCLDQIAIKQPQHLDRNIIEKLRRKQFKKLKNPKNFFL